MAPKRRETDSRARRERRWHVRGLIPEERFTKALADAAAHKNRGKPEIAYRIYKTRSLLVSAREAKQSAMKKAERLSSQHEFGQAAKIYSMVDETSAAKICQKRETAYKDAVRNFGLGNLNAAKDNAYQLAKFGAFGTAAELLDDIALQLDPQQKELVAQLKSVAGSLREREASMKRRGAVRPRM